MSLREMHDYYDVTLIYSFEKKGVLSNPEDDDSVTNRILSSI